MTETVRITIGFTKTDRESNYVPMMDGYRAGAEQELVVVDMPRALLPVVIAQTPELFFGVTNAPLDAIQASPRMSRMHEHFVSVGQTFPRSISVGDTVSYGDERWACARRGWDRA